MQLKDFSNRSDRFISLIIFKKAVQTTGSLSQGYALKLHREKKGPFCKIMQIAVHCIARYQERNADVLLYK